MSYGVFPLDEHTWRIEEVFGENGSVYMYLLEGEKEALLIDTGMGTVDLQAVTRTLTDKPVMLLNTHFHFDHVGGNGQFETAMFHPADLAIYESAADPNAAAKPAPGVLSTRRSPVNRPVQDGDVLDLGGRELEIIHTPGHTVGSICVLDAARRWVFTGDTCCKADVLLNLGNCTTVEKYAEGLRHLKSFADRFDTTWPAHHAVPVAPEIIDRFLTVCEGILSGEKSGFETNHIFGACLRAEGDEVAVLYMPDAVR